MDVQFTTIQTPTSGPITIEYRWINPEHTNAPWLVFLHEGLGSVAMWKDWPQQVCDAGGFRGLMFSRPGYGRSTPRPANEKWPVDYLHRQTYDILPAFLEAVGVTHSMTTPVWLIGHSDGGSIALLFAAAFPHQLAGAVVIAPHLFVETLSLQSIAQTKTAYQTTDLRQKLARYHADVDSAFEGWSEIWLAPEFRDWNIEATVAHINTPLLAVQGVDDAYGTMAQIDAIAKQVPHAQIIKLLDCGHVPHREAPEVLNAAIVAFIANAKPSDTSEKATTSSAT